MSLDKATVKKIAVLSRINVKDEELEGLAGELSGIVNFIEQLKEVNTDNVEPMASVAEMVIRQREDEITDGGYHDKILANAPMSDEEFYIVPRVVE